ncbi:MAG: hypothetical protein ACTHK7_00350, partial [Aureliella sp.]
LGWHLLALPETILADCARLALLFFGRFAAREEDVGAGWPACRVLTARDCRPTVGLAAVCAAFDWIGFVLDERLSYNDF